MGGREGGREGEGGRRKKEGKCNYFTLVFKQSAL